MDSKPVTFSGQNEPVPTSPKNPSNYGTKGETQVKGAGQFKNAPGGNAGKTAFKDKASRDWGKKDSSTGKEVGAGGSVAQNDKSPIAEAFELFCRECNPMNHPVICESGALGNLVRPGLLIFISHSNADLQGHKLDAMNQADMVFPAKNFSTREIISKMDFSENKWHLIS
jgi:hypothetical protein